MRRTSSFDLVFPKIFHQAHSIANKCGLLPRYLNGVLKTANSDSTRAAVASLVQTYRAAAKEKPTTHSNIIHIVHSVPDGTPIFTPKTPLAAEFDEIIPLEGEPVIAKHFPGSFTGTDLDASLKLLVADGDKRGKKVVLAGYMAHVCVSMTARQASELGYDVVIVGDAVGDRDIPGARGEEVTRMVLAELADAVGTVVESKDIKA